MSYTLMDWFRDNAQVRVRVPAPPGSGRTWYEFWLPYSVFDEGAYSPDWMTNRTHAGNESIEFLAHLAANERQ